MPKPLCIVFQAGVNPQSSAQLLSAITNALNNGFDSITLLISSPGGSVFHGISIANLIKAAPVPVTVHNVGQIDSIAGVIFAAGKPRLASQNSSFLFHGVSTGFDANARLTEQQLEERVATLKRDRSIIAKNIADYAGVELKKVQRLMKKGAILSAEQAKVFGLVDEIAEANIPKGIQVFTISG